MTRFQGTANRTDYLGNLYTFSSSFFISSSANKHTAYSTYVANNTTGDTADSTAAGAIEGHRYWFVNPGIEGVDTLHTSGTWPTAGWGYSFDVSVSGSSIGWIPRISRTNADGTVQESALVGTTQTGTGIKTETGLSDLNINGSSIDINDGICFDLRTDNGNMMASESNNTYLSDSDNWFECTNLVSVSSGLSYDATDSTGSTDTVEFDYGKGIVDTTGLTDSRAFIQAKGILDGSGLSDEAIVALLKNLSLTDNMSLTDSATIALEKIRNITDVVGLSDNAILQIAYDRAFLDSAGITDDVTRSAAYSRSFDDAVGLTDDYTVDKINMGTTFTVDFTDLVGIQDSIVKNLNYGLVYQDLVGLAETIYKLRGHTKQDSMNLTDLVNRGFPRSDSDSMSMTDEFSITLNRGIVETDPVALSDTAAFEVGLGRTDDLVITDVIEMLKTMQRVIEDGVGLIDEATVTLPNAAAYTDNMNITDSATVTLILNTLKDPSHSIVDDRRLVVQGFFSMTDDEVKVLTIGDLAYKYWSFLSQLSPVERQSLYDHFKTYAPDGKHWIEDITEQP